MLKMLKNSKYFSKRLSRESRSAMAYSKSSELSQGVFFAPVSLRQCLYIGQKVQGETNQSIKPLYPSITTSHELARHLSNFSTMTLTKSSTIKMASGRVRCRETSVPVHPGEKQRLEKPLGEPYQSSTL